MAETMPSQRNRTSLKRVFKAEVVAAAIRDRIRDGSLLSGDPLVSERTLASTYNVSLVSVRRALALLEKEGLIEKKWGLGNFVRGAPNGGQYLGVIVPHLRNSMYVEFLREIIFQAEERGYHVVVADADNKEEKEGLFIQNFAERGVKNVLKFPNIIPAEEKIRKQMVHLGINFVVINDFWTDLPSTQVRVDEVCGTSLIMEHLFSLRHQAIAYLDDGKELRKRMYSCYRRCLQAKGSFRKEFVYLGTTEGVALTKGIQFLLERKGAITACLTPYDCFAIFFLENLVRRYSYKVPEDLAICGFDDISEAGKPDISLTTVRQPREKIISEALNLLLDERKSPDSSVTVEVKPTLMIRRSTDSSFVADQEVVKETVRKIERRWTI